MRKKTVLWTCAAALVVAASALLPGLVLRVQDARLAKLVQSQPVETVDLALLPEMSIEDTLRFVQTCQTPPVVLDSGRQRSDGVAARVCQDLLEDMNVPLDLGEAVPELWVGDNGQSLLLWHVSFTGQGLGAPVWVAEAPLSALRFRPVEAEFWVDDGTGWIVRFFIHWSEDTVEMTEEEVIKRFEEMFGVVPDDLDAWEEQELPEGLTDPAWEQAEYDYCYAAELLVEFGGRMQLRFTDVRIGQNGDGTENAAWAAMTVFGDDGEQFPVQAVVSWEEMSFNMQD